MPFSECVCVCVTKPDRVRQGRRAAAPPARRSPSPAEETEETSLTRPEPPEPGPGRASGSLGPDGAAGLRQAIWDSLVNRSYKMQLTALRPPCYVFTGGAGETKQRGQLLFRVRGGGAPAPPHGSARAAPGQRHAALHKAF